MTGFTTTPTNCEDAHPAETAHDQMSRNAFADSFSDDGEGDGEIDFSDEDEYGNAFGSDQSSGGDRTATSAADRRAHHNALERKRRDHIKDSFSSLRDAVPSLSGEKVAASRAQILKKAAEYIEFMKVKNQACVQDLEEIVRENRKIEAIVRKMEMELEGRSNGRSFSPNDEHNESLEATSDNSSNSSTSGTSQPIKQLTSTNGTSMPVSIIRPSMDNNNSNNKSNPILLNGQVVRNATVVKSGTAGKIIVQNPSHKGGNAQILHVATPTTGAATVAGTGTPILLSTNHLTAASSTNGNGANGGGTTYVLSKGPNGAISLPNGIRLSVVQPGTGSIAATGTATPNIHIVSGIQTNGGFVKTTGTQPQPLKKLKISHDNDSFINSAAVGGATNSATSVSS